MLKLIISRIRRFFPQWRLYSFSVAFWSFLFPLYRIFGPLRANFAIHKHKSILQYLYKRYIGIINQFTGRETKPESAIEPGSTIWVCWWDGEEAMPDLVKTCYRSIRQYAGTHPVQLITKHNFSEYISIPEYILNKVNNGIMTVTHFSNILRANLLYEYGGIWIDATILILKEISLENLPFYTLKAPAKKSISVTLSGFSGLSNPSIHFRNILMPEISRWSGFLLAGAKHSPIFEYMRDILYAYWQDHDDQIDYLLFDYTIALGYDNIPLMRKLFDDVQCSDTEKFELEKNLNTEFTDECLALYSLTPFHKLTWKKEFNMYTKENKLTIYGHLINSLTGDIA